MAGEHSVGIPLLPPPPPSPPLPHLQMCSSLTPGKKGRYIVASAQAALGRYLDRTCICS